MLSGPPPRAKKAQTADYFISGQKISSSGEALGEPVEVLKTEDILMLPRVLYNPNKNQYLVIYCLGESYFNIRGVILDAGGRAVGGHFKVTDVPANQFHYTMAFNSRRNQFLITYNDFRDDISTAYGVIIDDTGGVSERRIRHQQCAGPSGEPRGLLQPGG